MRILFFTTEEPFYLPIFFDRILSERAKDVVGIVIVPPAKSKKALLRKIKQVIHSFGMKFFLTETILVAYYKILDVLSIAHLSKPFSVKRVAKKYSILSYFPKNINDPAFLALVRKLEIDLIVSVSTPQIFKKSLLSIPKLGCINIHGAPLPKYRGMLPSFWMLANGEAKAGVTVHYMNEHLDDGDIILQVEFDITPDDILHSLIRRSKKVGAELLLKAITQIENGTVVCKPNNRDEATYYSFPTREDVRKFR